MVTYSILAQGLHSPDKMQGYHRNKQSLSHIKWMVAAATEGLTLPNNMQQQSHTPPNTYLGSVTRVQPVSGVTNKADE